MKRERKINKKKKKKQKQKQKHIQNKITLWVIINKFKKKKKIIMWALYIHPKEFNRPGCPKLVKET